jgi:hypothetical protein
MRIEVNLKTGEITEHEDAPVTWEVNEYVPPPQPTKAELIAQLQELTTKIEALGVN